MRISHRLNTRSTATARPIEDENDRRPRKRDSSHYSGKVSGFVLVEGKIREIAVHLQRSLRTNCMSHSRPLSSQPYIPTFSILRTFLHYNLKKASDVVFTRSTRSAVIDANLYYSQMTCFAWSLAFSTDNVRCLCSRISQCPCHR